MLEAAIVPPEDYGTPLLTSDVAKYHALARMSKCPLLIPTQKAITPDDLPSLHREGIGGIMIGAIVTGSMAHSIEKVTCKFRDKMDQLSGE